MIKVFGATDGTMQRGDEPLFSPSTQDPLRLAERGSIWTFVQKYQHKLLGRVLDFGAGKPGTCREPQPYRDLVAGEYVPYDKGDALPNGEFDAILCTQVAQYIRKEELFSLFRNYLQPRRGVLVMTYGTNWPEVEPGDLYRYTKAGMEEVLEDYGFTIEHHQARAALVIPPNEFVLGYGVVAQAARV